MTLTLEDWHRRFRMQARWTESIRAHLFSRAGLDRGKIALEAGCGTGAVSAPAALTYPRVRFIGVDIDEPRLRFARGLDRKSRYAGGDARGLPFPDETFDLSFCHYLLLWIPDPLEALREMARVTRRGGWVAALAEPDYGGRIDYPPPLDSFGRRQAVSLRRQGADPEVGRSLAGMLASAGVQVRDSGVLGAQIRTGEDDAGEAESERRMLLEDLGDELTDAERRAFLAADHTARTEGRRVLFVPTFYAAGIRE
jgi:SAM-dependent methyltransferase